MHDYRYNPFLNALEPIVITGETHVIPTNSPFTIRLQEVPLKESPSTVSLTIGGVAGVEVAAEPAAGEFRCDYTTGADQDDNWNTGLIQFNAADAGKTVVAAYNGMGTLASVTADRYPSFWLERGNSIENKVFTNNETIRGIVQYKNCVIPTGVTVIANGFARILCTETFVNRGTIKADGTGSLGGYYTTVRGGESQILSKTNYPAENSFGGGAGGASYDGGVGGGVDISCRWFIYAETLQNVAGLGGGGGGVENVRGGTGGGSIQVVCNAFDSTGTISTKGNNGQANNACGGGGGGLVFVCCNTLIRQGTIITTGGTGGSYNGMRGANGGNGPIIIKEIGL